MELLGGGELGPHGLKNSHCLASCSESRRWAFPVVRRPMLGLATRGTLASHATIFGQCAQSPGAFGGNLARKKELCLRHPALLPATAKESNRFLCLPHLAGELRSKQRDSPQEEVIFLRAERSALRSLGRRVLVSSLPERAAHSPARAVPALPRREAQAQRVPRCSRGWLPGRSWRAW